MDASYLNVVITWLEHNNEWLGLVIVLVAFLESLVAVGIVLPGVAMLFALGVAAGAGALDIWSTMLCAFAGAVIGDGVSFWLGYRYHQRLRGWWPFKQHPQWLDRGELFFHKYGVLSVVIGRFVGPIRPIIPVVAGMMDMQPVKFYSVNIVSAIGWAPVYLLPGFLTGAALSVGDQLPDQFLYLLAGLAAFAMGLPAIFILLRKCLGQWPFSSSVLTLLCFIGLMLLYGADYEAAMNDRVAEWILSLKTPLLIHAMEWVTWFGSLSVLCALLLCAAGWFAVQKRLSELLPLLWCVPLMEASLWMCKWLVNHPRPGEMVELDPFSFPSGHTTQAAFFLFGMAMALSRKLNNKCQWTFQTVALFITMMVALSRLILNVHWFGDVLAGLCLGLFWAQIGVIMQSKRHTA